MKPFGTIAFGLSASGFPEDHNSVAGRPSATGPLTSVLIKLMPYLPVPFKIGVYASIKNS